MVNLFNEISSIIRAGYEFNIKMDGRDILVVLYKSGKDDVMREIASGKSENLVDAFFKCIKKLYR